MARGSYWKAATGLILILIGVVVIAYRGLSGGSLVALAVGLGEKAVNYVGLGGVAALMALESCAIPIPSELIVPLAAARYTGIYGLIGVVAAATAGNMVGSTALYAIGLWGGRDLAYRYGERVGLSRRALQEAEALFERRGHVIVLLGRMMPAVRTYVSLPAGVAVMSFTRFAAYTLLGSLAWNTALAALGYALTWTLAIEWLDLAGAAILIAVGIALLLGARLG